jgi:tRNA threonylcarbamoyladenosine modification (KEOPS) complex  Pcc1 subunit
MKVGIRANASLRIGFKSQKQMRAIADALRPEANHPARARGRVRIIIRGRRLTLHFEAKNSTTLRAMMTSYLRMIAASLKACDALIELERSSAFKNR